MNQTTLFEPPTVPDVALTVRAVWAHLIVDGVKDVENRSWRIDESRLPLRIWVHVGGRYDRMSARRAAGVDLSQDWWKTRSAILGTAVIYGITRSSRSAFAETGSHHWLLRDPRRLPVPVRCDGQLGLWRPARNVADAAAAQLASLQ